MPRKPQYREFTDSNTGAFDSEAYDNALDDFESLEELYEDDDRHFSDDDDEYWKEYAELHKPTYQTLDRKSTRLNSSH